MASSTPLQSVDLSKKGGDFQATPEELKTIEERMKDPVFMDLLREYMQALEDPETRREEEAYLEQAEREAREGGDFSFEFIFPRPQFVVELLKPTTTILSSEERQKIGLARTTAENKRRCESARAFVNICASEKVEACHEETTGDRMGSHWHVPVSVSQKRVEFFRPLPASTAASSSSSSSSPTEDTAQDKEKTDKTDGDAVCFVYDAVFHPDTLALVDRSARFLCFLVEIAVEHINGGYKESNGFEFTRLPSRVQSIGQPQNQTVRTQGGRSPFAAQPDLPVLTHPQKPESTNAASTTRRAAPTAAATTKPAPPATATTTTQPAPATTLPPHSIAHRGQLDLTEAWQWKVVDRRVGVPQELVVKMTFAGVQRAAALDVDITEDGTAIALHKTAQQDRYDGLIVLPFTVQTTPVSAKFERHSGVLTLVLAVVPPPLSEEASALRQEVVQRAVATPLRPEEKQEATVESAEPAPEPPQTPDAPEAVHATTDETEVGDASAQPPTAPLTEPAPALAPSSATSDPVTAHISDNERAQAAMAKVMAARRARETAAQAMAGGGEDPTPAPVSADGGAALSATPPATTTTTTVKGEQPEDEPAAQPEEEIPFITKRDVRAEAAQAEEAALLARQDAWRQMVQEQLDAIAAAESEELAMAEEAAAREAAKTRKKAELAKQQETLELQALEKMKTLPLSNKHIFAIE